MVALSKATQTSGESLETVLAEAGGPVKLLRSSALGPYVFPAIPPEFTNWRDEQRAWRDGVVLKELSFHMQELHLKGPGALDLLKKVSLNKLDRFPPTRAKQLVVASHDGYLVGDVIVFHESENFYRLVGAPFASNWVNFHAETGGFDVQATSDLSYSVRTGDRDVYRVQVLGPHALEMMRDATGAALPDIPFFHIGELKIAGRTVRALRHGMAGTPGFELYGPWNDQQVVREALARAGEKYGMRKVGSLAYSTNPQDSAWMPMPLPAIYHSKEMKPYREWLTPFHLETVGSLGGSFVSDKIEDYYSDPVELGYGSLIDLSRDFIGRQALEQKLNNQKRTKVTLEWNRDDVLSVLRGSLFPDKKPARYLNTPNPMYATFQSDAVMKNGSVVGISQWPGYSANAGLFLSLALVDTEQSAPGTEVTLLWGEPNSKRPTVEAHEVREIKARVAPAPYFEKVIKTREQ